MTAPLEFEPSTPPMGAWVARLARIGVASNETRPRLFSPATRLLIGVHSPVAPLTDATGEHVGTVEHVASTGQWLYAFGFVYDPDMARLMRRTLVPEFAMTNVRTAPPVPGEPLTILDGHITAVRAVPNPLTRPAGTTLWTGLAFTVEAPQR